MPPPEFPPGNHITKGGHSPKYDFVNSIYVNYLFLSPKNQARQLGEHMPYQGKRNVDLKIRVELIETYGRLDKNFKYYFLLTIFNKKGKT